MTTPTTKNGRGNPVKTELELPAHLAVVDGHAVDVPKSPLQLWRPCLDDVATICERAPEPWIMLRLGGDELVRIRAGGIVTLVGPTGRGKTSLAACLLVEHAREFGPALGVSLELPPDEWTARIIGTRRDASWPSVLLGEVPESEMRSALPDRLVRIDRSSASVDTLGEQIALVRGQYADGPMLVAVDYLQLIGSEGDDDIRPRVGKNMRKLDEIARTHRVVMLVLSQGSRASSRALSSGERIGADTTDSGAESSDIERWASVTLAIGQMGSPSDDGASPADLSIGKSRMGGGDQVVPCRYHGRSGLWRVAGEARSATDVRAERGAARQDQKMATLTHAIASLLAKAGVPMSRREIRTALGGTDQLIRDAVRALLETNTDVVEVEPRSHGAYPVWTRDRASTSGRIIREPAR